MNTPTLGHHAASRTCGSYGFRSVAQMEWQKLRTVRSTWFIVAIFAGRHDRPGHARGKP